MWSQLNCKSVANLLFDGKVVDDEKSFRYSLPMAAMDAAEEDGRMETKYNQAAMREMETALKTWTRSPRTRSRFPSPRSHVGSSGKEFVSLAFGSSVSSR